MGQEPPATAVAPPATTAAAITEAQAAAYVWQAPLYGQPNESAKPFVEELRQQVAKIVQAGHLAPLWYAPGLSDGWGATCWGNPGDVVWSISETLPYLDEPLAAKAVAYLDAEIAKYPPWAMAKSPALEGKPRTAYEPIFWYYTDSYQAKVTVHRPWMWPKTPEDLAANPILADSHSGLAENLYALYLFARNADRWNVIAEHWADIQKIGQGIEPKSAGELAGLIAYARLAKHAGKADLAEAAAAKAAAALTKAVDFESFTKPGGGIVVRASHAIAFPGLYNMTPEVGRFLGEHAREAVDKALAPAIANPLWYLTKEHGGYGENHMLGPQYTWAIFQTQAYALGDKDLAGHVDLPWVELGDLYHLQKLVAVLRSSSTVEWK